MAGNVQIEKGSAQAISVESAALFAQTQRKANFSRMMRGPKPQQPSAERKARDQM